MTDTTVNPGAGQEGGQGGGQEGGQGLSEAERTVSNHVASALFAIESQADLPEDEAARREALTRRREAFQAARREYGVKARRLLRLLEQRGITLTASEEALNRRRQDIDTTEV